MSQKNKDPQPPFDVGIGHDRISSDRISSLIPGDDIELPEELLRGYKELNEKLEETIQRIQRKRQLRKRRKV